MNINYFKDYKNIFACDLFVEEEGKLYAKNQADQRSYDRWLDRQLRFLDTIGLLRALNEHSHAFEKLSGVQEGIYAITNREFSGNPRILFFAIIEGGEPDAFVLLVPFKEKNEGDYRRHIPVAKARRKAVLEILKEDEDNEPKEQT